MAGSLPEEQGVRGGLTDPHPTAPGAIAWRWLGRVRYAEALERQRALREAVIDGSEGEALLLLEHEPVVTVGRREAPGTPTAKWLAERGVDFHRVERGGLATWHGPGQLVVYVVVRAEARGLGPRALVSTLEEGVIAWLSEQGVAAGRREGHRGVWIGKDKICAVGLHFRSGVSLHGVALNLRDPPRDSFDLIVPCGITDGGITSLERAAGRAPTPEDAASGLAKHLIAVIDATSRR